MSGKGKLITIAVFVVGTVAIVVVVAIVAGIFFLRSSTDSQAIGPATSVGVPNGATTTKRIGPEGGSIMSTDGRITVDVPANAVTAAVDFRITPITNPGKGAVGNAYRLEPNEQKFATPIKVSFKYDAEGLKDAAPESFAVAYQDPTGVWQALKTSNIDSASKTVSVSTTHFTDWALWTIRLEPEKVTIRVGEKVHIEPIQCVKPTNFYQRFQDFLGNQPCIALWPQTKSWSVNIGMLTPITAGVIYTAPATKPAPNVVTVRFVYHLRGESPGEQEARECEITIVDRGYRATGSDGPVVYSGVICNLEKSFTITGTHPMFVLPLKFDPSSKTTGSMSYGAEGSGITSAGRGSYTIEGLETDRPRIVVNSSSTASTRFNQTSGGGVAHIELVPLESNSKECGNN